MSNRTRNETRSPSYFLLSVSTRENLDLCLKYALAGFPSGESGAWTFCEIEQGDFVSFLYGARVHNLYRVTQREAIIGAENLPPWKPLIFTETRATYFFPFRLRLQPLRIFVEPIARSEFFYVAENLLLRGGYRKTHFQADQTTLQNVSEMGTATTEAPEPLVLPKYDTFKPRFTQNRELVNAPEVCRYREAILQSAIRRHLAVGENLKSLLSALSIKGITVGELEILGEKALTQGHIDLLLKERVPIGSSTKIPIEVKTKKGRAKDILQLQGYMDEMRGECPAGLLIAADFAKQGFAIPSDCQIRLVRYAMKTNLQLSPTFEEIYESLVLEPL